MNDGALFIEFYPMTDKELKCHKWIVAWTDLEEKQFVMKPSENIERPDLSLEDFLQMCEKGGLKAGNYRLWITILDD